MMARTRNFRRTGWSRAVAVVLLTCIPALVTASEPRHPKDLEAAYRHLNLLRARTGLLEFRKEDQLAASAADHARYLSLNTTIGHIQSLGNRGFTGETPGERAVVRGYASRAVTENFSIGQKHARQSIDNLMSAIYHRFAFLDVSKNQLGVGSAKGRNGLFFVYNMGNDRLDHLCRFSIFEGKGSFITDACGHNGKVSAAEFELRRREVGSRNPELILWPHENAKGVPTVFYEEIPDPLPDYKVSGYPVSVQLNPFRVKKAELQRFRLIHQKINREVKPVRIVTREIDPQQRFSNFDFALFPLNRLDWDTPYRVEVSLVIDGKKIRKTWSFRTVAPSHPLFIISGHREILKLQSRRSYLVHVPAARRLPYIESLRWESMSGLKTEVVWQDRNTLRVRLAGDTCESARFMFNGNRSFTLQVAESDNLNERQQYERGAVTSCVLDTIKDLPGFKITAGGEVIPMNSGENYWVEIAEARNPVTEIRWRLVNGMTARVSQLDGNLLKIAVTGKPGQIATFFLSGNRIFKVVLAK